MSELAEAILTYLQQHSENKNKTFSPSELHNVSKANLSAIQRAFVELENAGYIYPVKSYLSGDTAYRLT